MVEARQLLAARLFDDVRLANRDAFRIPRSLELHLKDLVNGALAGAKVHAPLGKHDAALVIDAALIERGRVRPVVKDEQRSVEHAGNVGRDAERVLRVVVTGLRVGVRAETHAERRQKREDALLWKMLGSLEFHVLVEVRDPLLVVVFQHGAGLDDEAQLGAMLGPLVRAHVVAQTVRQRADDHFRVDGHLLRERVRRDRRG